jgi:hypothetical protein
MVRNFVAEWAYGGRNTKPIIRANMAARIKDLFLSIIISPFPLYIT